jgi:hypothetical protein
MKLYQSILVAWLLGLMTSKQCFSAPPVNIGGRLELFVDRYLVERLENVRFNLGVPHREEIALSFDAPWEGAASGAYVTVMKDGDLYRMYYRGRALTGDVDADKNSEVTCYAESHDGIHWAKPNLGLYEFRGSRANNIIVPSDPRRVSHNFSAFLDTRLGVPHNERYKAVGGGAKKLYRLVSGDGIHWRDFSAEPLFSGYGLDTQNVAIWSPVEELYVIFLRTGTEGGTPEQPVFRGVRSIARSTSKDFVNWSKPELMNFGDTPPEHLYTNATQPYFRAPHILIALPMRFVPNRQILSQQEMDASGVAPSQRTDTGDAVLMSSRGGTVYDRTFMESFIRPGLDRKNWSARNNYPALGVVPTNNEEMSIYVSGHYTLPDNHLRRYSLRTDGFASVKAPYEGGELMTKPLVFVGRKLVLNYSTSAAGSLRVELLDEAGDVLAGYTARDCEMVTGDEIAREISWKKGGDLGVLAGRPVKLRFVLRDAELYSFRFIP